MRRLLKLLALSLICATPLTAEEGCQAKDAVVYTAVGAGVGSVAAIASVWTIGVLAAPFTLGSSLVGAASMTLPAIALGAKGGALYGASAEAIQCGKVAVEGAIDWYEPDDNEIESY